MTLNHLRINHQNLLARQRPADEIERSREKIDAFEAMEKRQKIERERFENEFQQPIR